MSFFPHLSLHDLRGVLHVSLGFVPSQSDLIKRIQLRSVISHFNDKFLTRLAIVISVLQKAAAGTETKIPRADYFSVSGSTTPGFPAHGHFLTARRQVDVAQ